jgi:DNA replication protein DnaC
LGTFNFDYTPNLKPQKINAFFPTAIGSIATNVLFFGRGVGKTHRSSFMLRTNSKIYKGQILFATALLQQSKRPSWLKLEQLFTKLDGYSVIVLDDLGYVKKSGGKLWPLNL